MGSTRMARLAGTNVAMPATTVQKARQAQERYRIVERHAIEQIGCSRKDEGSVESEGERGCSGHSEGDSDECGSETLDEN